MADDPGRGFIKKGQNILDITDTPKSSTCNLEGNSPARSKTAAWQGDDTGLKPELVKVVGP